MNNSKCVIRVNFAARDCDMASAAPLDGRDYDYFYLGEAQAGQYAVVMVGNALKVVKINKVLLRSSKASKYALTVFSLDAHKEALAKMEQAEGLKEAIEVRVRELSWMENMQKLAASDSELAAMLEELKALKG